MTVALRDALDEVAREGIDGIHLPTLATDAVRRRRRSQVRRLVVATAGVALTALFAVTVTPGWGQLRQRLSPASGPTRVAGHPAHIGWQWPVRDLPARPGPMAGLLSGVDGGPGWWVVRADGHRFRLRSGTLDDSRPALSVDGRWLGYVAPDSEHFVVHDLVTGRRIVLAGIGDASSRGFGKRLQLAGQSPGFWSARRDLFAGTGSSGDRNGVVIVDAQRATVRFVDATGLLAGWLPDASAFVTVEVRTRELANPDPQIVTGTTVTSGVRVHLVRVGGGGTVVDLRPRGGWSPDDTYSQWSWAVSPDGTTLLAGAERLGSEGLSLRRFRISDGHQVGGSRTVAAATTACSVGWVDRRTVSVPVIDSRQQTGRVLVDVANGRLRTATAVSTHVVKDGGCLEESGLALTGAAISKGPFGLSTAVWTAWALAIALVLAVAFVVRRRRWA